MTGDIRNLLYLLAAVLFIFGIKGLTHPRTAVRGNMLGAMGMLLAVVVTLVDKDIIGWVWIVAGLAVGSGIGAVLAVRIKMTAMPQLVGLFNGFGGLASFLVAGAALIEAQEIMAMAQGSLADFIANFGGDASAEAARQRAVETLSTSGKFAVAASGLIGAVTFSGSLVAFGKLQEYWWLDKWVVKGQQAINSLLALAVIVVGIFLVARGETWAYVAIVAIALLMGVLLTTPIGGADMPVVIALLNSYSGLAAAATGFVISNNVLIIAGSLVGASGLILSKIMCVAMNRSLTNVLFGVMADAADAPSADDVYAGKVKSTSAEEVAMLFDTARRVLIVPGYGMAVAQAQHAVRGVATLLEERGIEVEYGVHPVAGRMPGHMNVLLAEADVAYEKLKEMDDVNSTMDTVDVAIVLGANDTVNPAAREDPTSPIAGMPIIDVDKARTVIVIKRSLSPGFAGIPNPLFAADNTLMLFGDGKKAMIDLVAAIKESG